MARALDRVSLRLAAVVCVAGLGACGGSAPPPPDRTPAPPLAGEFSAERAWADLEALVALGPRPAGSHAAAAARGRIRDAAEDAGAEVEEVETHVEPPGVGPLTLTHVVATLPGTSPDRFVFVAPYDSGRYPGVEFVGANEGASGAALLMELVRVLAERPSPYTLRFVWLEGEGRIGNDGEAAAQAHRWGSESLARLWDESGQLEGIRLLVAFDRVCDADLEIARDLRSFRQHREEFWRAAARLGRTDAFRPDRGFETFEASHLAFRKRGVRPVVAIEDTVFGGDEAPGLYTGTEQDDLAHCAPASLEAVGSVTLEVVETLGERLARIDRFTRAPSAAQEEGGEDTPSEADAAEPATPGAGGRTSP